MTTPCFSHEYIDNVAHITLQRPETYNAMNPEFWADLPRIVSEISDKGKARAIVITSTGKHFSSGMDLSVFAGQLAGDTQEGAHKIEEGRKRVSMYELVTQLQKSFTCFEDARMPVLVAIQGGCIGGAVDLVSACDLRYCTKDAYFVIQEINIGMTADVGTLQRLPKLIPSGIALEYAFTGEKLSAQRAYELGLVSQVFDSSDEMIASVLDIAKKIAAKSPLAIYGTKKVMQYTRDHSVAESLNFVAAWQSGMFQPNDMIETFVAKSEGRQPVYDDLSPLPKGL